MDLGTTISRLRTAHGMSQGDLAEALDVSRQSVSKWETGASVPELEKLVKLAQLFEISLDELVTGQPPRETGAPPPSEVSPPSSPPPVRAPHRIAGIVLLSLAGLLSLLLNMLNAFWPGVYLPPPLLACGVVCLCSSRQRAGIVLLSLAGLVFFTFQLQLHDILNSLLLAAPFLACGTICLRCRRRVGLWCAWVCYLHMEMYLFWVTILPWLDIVFTPKKLYLYLAIGLHLIVLLGMLLITIRSFRTVRIDLKQRKNALLLVLGWASLLLLRLLIWYISPFDLRPPSMLFLADDLALIALFAALLTATVCGLPSLRSPSPRP
jgi:transcriptional regulator with XRE-family HTH domain